VIRRIAQWSDDTELAKEARGRIIASSADGQKLGQAVTQIRQGGLFCRGSEDADLEQSLAEISATLPGALESAGNALVKAGRRAERPPVFGEGTEDIDRSAFRIEDGAFERDGETFAFDRSGVFSRDKLEARGGKTNLGTMQHSKLRR